MSETKPTTTTTTTPEPVATPVTAIPVVEDENTIHIPPPGSTKEPIAWRFTPVRPGEHMIDIPARDLTQADVDALTPAQRRDATGPGPSGKPMYQPVEKE